MISAIDLSMRFGGKILFKNAHFQLNTGGHYGLVGANGSGKSTLIKILSGELTPESGDVAVPSQIRIGSLKQDHYRYEEVPILDVVLMGKTALWNALEEKQTLLQKEHFTETECHRLDELEKQIGKNDGYAAESLAAKLLEGLGIPSAAHRHPLKTLSGGYKLRVLLAQVLFSEPEILLLDEPTNHLDLFSIRWLEGYLNNFPGTLLLSSHDRNFLNGVCDHMIDLDHETLKIYKGNFEDFVSTKAFFLEQNEAILAKQNKRKDDMQAFVDRFRAKATKARQAQTRLRMVEKLEEEMSLLDLSPSSRRYPNVHFEQCRPSGAFALKVQGVNKSYGAKQVLNNISFEVERGDRVAFLGANGIGKSTLLEIVTQSIQAQSGQVTWGHAVQFAYFPQDHAKHVHGEHSVLSWLRQFDRIIPEEKLRDLLGRVLFTGDDVHKPVTVLSGGETARLLLARMMLLKHNVLIFDEPTNHLDMESSEALWEALQEYPGTLLFVSHNRHFVSQVANRIIELTADGLLDYRCSFEEYLEKRDHDLLQATNRPKEGVKSKEGALQYEQQKQQQRSKSQLERKLKAAEDLCHKLEMQMRAIDARLGTDNFYQNTPRDEIQSILQQKEDLELQFNKALLAWEELAGQ